MLPIPLQTKIGLQSLRGSQPLVILAFLTIQHGMTIEDLEEVTGLHNDTVRGAVKGLKGKGLEMQRGAHGRQTWLLKRETFFGLFGAEEIQSPKTSDSDSQKMSQSPKTSDSDLLQSPKTSDSDSQKMSQSPKTSDSDSQKMSQSPKTSDSGIGSPLENSADSFKDSSSSSSSLKINFKEEEEEEEESSQSPKTSDSDSQMSGKRTPGTPDFEAVHAACLEKGIRDPKAITLASLPFTTPQKVRDHVDTALGEGNTIGTAIYRIENNWPVAESPHAQRNKDGTMDGATAAKILRGELR